ncbi:PhzF family phenazine biosynthesis protein [Roseibium sp.]|uniref:PhzF family phenazine biosynthesis protein n=1 Tax=Roseibium sp. TaxID=1936156 RepID=UPI003BA9045B
MDIQRISAFSDGDTGGNPAGVLISDAHPSVEDMRAIAADVGFSETAFAAPQDDGAWRVRYFSPQSEVPFCGHATIALGSALTREFGPGRYNLKLNEAEISVEGAVSGELVEAALQSPPTKSRPALDDVVSEVMDLFGYTKDQIDIRIPPALVHGGADHFALTLNSREAVSDMTYDQEAGRKLMEKHSWVTILIAVSETPQLFHTRNAFASGGVYEDPATGAASAAYAGYLRDIGWPHQGRIEINQGFDMGHPSRIVAEIGSEMGSSFRVSGSARVMNESDFTD